MRFTPSRRAEPRGGREIESPPRGSRIARGCGASVPAPVLGRSATADQHRAGARLRSGPHNRRRTGVGAGCLYPGTNIESASGPTRPTRGHDAVHLARPRSRALSLRPGCRALSRTLGRDRSHRGGDQATATRVYPLFDCGGAAPPIEHLPLRSSPPSVEEGEQGVATETGDAEALDRPT